MIETLFGIAAALAMLGFLHDLIWEKQCDGRQLMFALSCAVLAVVSFLVFAVL
jgi:hypothetical protein